eukprot:6090158-Amphidinium_carterae.1
MTTHVTWQTGASHSPTADRNGNKPHSRPRSAGTTVHFTATRHSATRTGLFVQPGHFRSRNPTTSHTSMQEAHGHRTRPIRYSTYSSPANFVAVHPATLYIGFLTALDGRHYDRGRKHLHQRRP